MGEDVFEMRRFVARSEPGYTLPELLVVMAILGITALIAIPLVMSYMPGATVGYAAREEVAAK